ncbi:MAG TPA: GNAT family N-acetyltransferase [Novosphingobium sp.]|nr:GNAT family N-acetyltransferase [Novosphingobium sp.]
MVPTLETDRLILRPLTLDDEAAIQRIFPQWEIVRWLDAKVPWPYPDDGARFFLEQVALPQMARGEGWHWSIRRRAEPAELIGEITLQESDLTNRGFWIDPEWHGRGFASEAADAVTAFWFGTLDRPVLRIAKAAGNIASRRISQKQGMRMVRQFEGELVSGPCPFELWELTREEWRGQTGREGHSG